MDKNQKLFLMILDGWGIGDGSEADAIARANTPFIDGLYKQYPNSTLITFGESVGLPDGQMGNSEVGHLNIGAGRVVYQDLALINKSIREGDFAKKKSIQDCFRYVKEAGKTLHLIGLVSDGGVHSSQEHLHALCRLAGENGIHHAVHAFTDGRDTDPTSGRTYISRLLHQLNLSGGKLASVTGRYYAMDRDKRWERVQVAYDAMVHGKGEASVNPIEAIERSYQSGVTDEFIKPIIITRNDGTPLATISEGDAVICFNFRTDRCREITMALTQQDFPDHHMRKLDLHYVTMTNYDESFKDVHVVFEKENLGMTLGEVLSKAGKTQVRMAETEKYPHVTFFFSGGREEPFEGERRVLAPSPKVATYDLKPEMSAFELKDYAVEEVRKAEADFICLNFANPDMVGHTGVYDAIIKAVETVDACAAEIVAEGRKSGYSFLIIADHGNADYAINPDGSPNTAHSKNPVPSILIDDHFKFIRKGKLGDIAPTILTIMGLDIPEQMTGEVLV